MAEDDEEKKEAELEGGRMPFLSHLVELRDRLRNAAIAFVAAFSLRHGATFEGVAEYMRKHHHANATLADLLAELADVDELEHAPPCDGRCHDGEQQSDDDSHDHEDLLRG